MFKICTLLVLFLVHTLQLCDPNFCNCSNQVCTSCLTFCLPCPFQCATCKSQATCSSCVGSYYLANSTCLGCPKYCAVCSSVGCLKCMDGYGLSAGTCLACSIPNALSCEGADMLVSCASGYWQNGNSCSPCRQFCLICSSPSNCLQCQTGYQVAVSFGSYCSKCPTGCSACSSSLCTSCFYNYYLANGACVDITSNCTTIPNCQYCQLTNAALTCYSCYYPYYITGGTCVLGASLMCRNGAAGPLLYQCLNSCPSLAFAGGTSGGMLQCLALQWMGSTQQIYLNAYSGMFSRIYQTSSEWIYFDPQLSTNSKSIVYLPLALTPYYKLVFSLKLIAVGLAYQNLTTSITLLDNATNTENYTFTQALTSNNQPIYIGFTTRTISQQTVNFTLTNTASSSVFIAGLSEFLVQIYGCPSSCRLCFNAELCSQCYGNYFVTPNYQCVASCIGYLQLYMPWGDSSNYTYKQCVASCPVTFYPSTLNTSYSCLKCIAPCLNCISSTQCLTCVAPYLYYQINFTCLNSCPSTHYNASTACTPCSIPCATCSSSTNCLSCAVGYFSNGSCLTICPTGTFQNNLNNLCQACDAKCSSCEGSSTYCLSCNSPYLLFGSSCQSSCLSTLYYVEGSSCQMCVSPCLQCLNKTVCISCISGFFYNSSCLSTCPSGYFADSSDLTCKICQNGCLSCLSQTICLSCPNQTFLYSYSCVSSCVSGTYSSNSICMTCIQPCSSCTNSTYCLTCSIGYLSQLSPGTCLSSCELTYYAQNTSLTCEKCSGSCLTCSGSATSCLSCNNLLLLGQTCVSSCSKGYYSSEGMCLGCAFPCLSCDMQDYNCTSCQLDYILVNYDCITDCPAFNFLSNGTCSACLYPCLTCSAASSCLSCAINASSQTYLSGTQCLTTCPSGYYADSTSVSCVNCSYPCSTCTSQISCLSCAFGYLNPQTSTCGLCEANMYVNDSTKTCQLCNSSISGCINCVSANQCISCQSGLFLYNGSCITQQICNSKLYYYMDSQLLECLKCNYPCLTCLNSSYCSSCSSGYLWMGLCLGSCLTGYYQNQGTCSPCAAICLSCSNLTACLTCNTTSTLSTYSPELLTCINPSSCAAGYYIDTSLGSPLCSKCTSPCSSCANSSFCLSCLFGINYKGSCKSNCPTGYFTDNSNASDIKCSACSATCFSCISSANNCSSCSSSLYLKNGTCVSNCGEAFYLDSTIFECFSCISPCYNCSSASICVSCVNSSYILYYGQCLMVCPDGTYNSNQTCQSCPSSCLTCRSTNSTPTCILCNSDMFMSNSQPGVCLASCQGNQYGDNNTRNCYSCVSPCLSCTSAISCLSCIDNYLLYQTQCLAISKCPNTSFLLGRSCVSSCGLQWAVEQSAICSNQCSQPALKLITATANKCLISCPDNYFVDENYTCSQCNNSSCSNLLAVTVQVKSIFNVLYAKVSFNKNLNLLLINKQTVKVYVSPLQSSSRLLAESQIQFQVSTININAVWLKLSITSSVHNSLMSVAFSDYYVLGTPLQNLSFRTSEIISFDLYTTQQQNVGQVFQRFSEVMSLIMIVIFIADLTLNSGHLSYLIVDYYQLLFMVLFLSIDYPPHLNHFLYGFRYSHYLFLPQIFRTSPSREYSSYTPDKFGVVVPDVYFLNNTGQTFMIIGSALGILLLSKLVEVCIRKFQDCKNNKVGDTFMDSQPEEQSKLVLVLQGIVSRFKWNYFNDTIYTIYFSLMLFAFSQVYDLTWRDNAIFDLLSIILAFLFIFLGCLFPFLLAWFLQRQKDNLIQHSLSHEKEMLKSRVVSDNKPKQSLLDGNQELKQKSSKVSSHEQNQNQPQQSKNYEILTDFKCFVSGIKLKVKMGFYHIPIRYAKKLIFACLLVYCSQYPSLVLGVVMMTCFVDILVVLALKPYRLSFQQIIYPIFDGLYLLVFLTICVMQLPILGLSQSQKLNASYLAIAICILLALLLAIHNIVMNVLEIIKYFCKMDYLSKYYQTEYVETTEEGMMSEHENTHSPLVKQQLKEQSVKLQKQETSSVISGLDIYLKKQHNAPQYLIKCLKQEQEEEFTKKQQVKESEKIKVFDLNLDGSHSWNDQSESQVSKPNADQKQERHQQNLQKSNIFGKLQTLEFEENSEKF